MKRSLINQMRHEWRSNLWMIIELTIVSVVLWCMFCGIWTLINVRMLRTGYDINDLYVGEFRVITEESPFYEPYDSVHSILTDRDIILSRLRANPYVESVATGLNATTYSYCYIGMDLVGEDSIKYHGNARYVTPELINIYRLESRDGRTTEQLAQVIEKGELIISRPEIIYGSHTDQTLTDPTLLMGKEVFLNNDSSVVRRVGALAYGLRRSDYEALWSGVIYIPLPESVMPDQVILRIKPDKEREFLKSLKPDDKKAGNVYIYDLQSIEMMRGKAHLENNLMIRNFLIFATFLLLVIFLGFFGTFWFRTQQRVDEIAIRIVNGAKRSDIFRRFISEGMIMLCASTVIAIPLEFAVIHFRLLSYSQEHEMTGIEIYQSFAVTFILLALLIVAGIWFPARKAMNLNPVYALKDQ